MKEDCAETPRQDDISYCQNFNKSLRQKGFKVNHSKAEPEKEAALFIAITRVRL